MLLSVPLRGCRFGWRHTIETVQLLPYSALVFSAVAVVLLIPHRGGCTTLLCFAEAVSASGVIGDRSYLTVQLKSRHDTSVLARVPVRRPRACVLLSKCSFGP